MRRAYRFHGMASPESVFHSMRYLRSTMRRLEHLARLDLPIRGCSVLEVGAGIGDFTSFFLDRDCSVTSTEPREENIATLRERFESDVLWPSDRLRIVQSDIASLAANGVRQHDIVQCYQVLNFTSDPEAALTTLSTLTRNFLLLEVPTISGSTRDDDRIEFGTADATDVSSTLDGSAFVATRRWFFERLKRLFSHVYMPIEQPSFDRFRVDWRTAAEGRAQHRAIFVAATSPLENAKLVDRIPLLHV